MKNKKALSTVVSTVLIILLVIVAVTIVWASVKNFIKDQTEKTKCFDVEASDKVKINDYYTCYQDVEPDGDIDTVTFSIELGDVEIDGLVVSILFGGGTAGGSTKTYTITNTLQTISGLEPYPAGGPTTSVSLPDKNSGKTYVASGFGNGDYEYIDWIKIAPIVDGNQCGPSDQSYEVPDCSEFG